jgi:phosphomannomutase
MKLYLKLYLNFLEGFIEIKKPIKVVFDCSNGTTGIVLKKLFAHHSLLKTHYLNSKPDGRFPAHGPNPSLPGALKQLSQAVEKFKADIGVAFDADGDRAFFVDEKGREVPSYFVAALLSSFHKPPFVFDIFNFEALKYSGFRPMSEVFFSRVGTYFVKSEMARRKATLAVEYSGHYYFRDFFYADSGILAAIKVINALSSESQPFSKIAAQLLKKIFVSQFNLKIKDVAAFFDSLNKKYARKASKIIRFDGVTFEFKKGWLTARSSNTEPLVRLFIGGSKDFVSANKRTISKILKST